MLPAAIGLVLVLLWAGGAVYGLVRGLSARYLPRTDQCAALDVTAFAALLGDKAPRVERAADGDCLLSVGAGDAVPASAGTVTLSYLSSTVEAMLSYAVQKSTAGVDLPGLRGRLSVEPSGVPAGGCTLSVQAQRSNLLVTARLTVEPGTREELCGTGDAVTGSLSASLRASLDRLT
jgi:hypothetical protein